MTINFKKRLEKEETYIDKKALKHKHNYSINYLLIITNINKHASANYYGKKEYYYVLKCSECNSFIPNSIDGNYNHNIFHRETIDYNMPTIVANTTQKCPNYDFSKLIDVKVND